MDLPPPPHLPRVLGIKRRTHAGGACFVVVWERCSKWHHDAWERAWLIKLFSGPLLASLGRADPGDGLMTLRVGLFSQSDLIA